MSNLESKQILDFKLKHADLLAWSYSFCRNQQHIDPNCQEYAKTILNIASFLDSVEYQMSLTDSIRKKVGINPVDNDATKLDNIFPNSSNPNYQAASGWGEYVKKIFHIDLGSIEELFEDILAVLTAIYNFVSDLAKKAASKTGQILEELDILMENLKNMRRNTPLMIYMQTKLEMSQTARMSVA